MRQTRRAVSFNSRDLDKLERAGVPAKTLVTLLELIAKRGWERTTPETREKLLDKRDQAKSLAMRFEKLRRDAREFSEADPFLGIQGPVYVLDETWRVDPELQKLAMKVNPASQVGRALDSMGWLAKSMRETSSMFGQMSRRNGGAYRGIDFILGWILICNDKFHCWEPLSHLLVEALRAAGINDTEKITAEWVGKRTKRRITPMHRSVFKGE
jgi:hypothetical protein